MIEHVPVEIALRGVTVVKDYVSIKSDLSEAWRDKGSTYEQILHELEKVAEATKLDAFKAARVIVQRSSTLEALSGKYAYLENEIKRLEIKLKEMAKQ